MYYLKFSLSPGLTVGSTPLNHLFEGGRRAGRVSAQRKRFKNTLNTSVKDFSIDVDAWKSLASDCPTWGGLIFDGARSAESNGIRAAEVKQQAQKDRAVSTQTYQPTWVLRPDWPYQPPADTQIDPASFPMSSSTTKDEQQTTC